MSFSSSLSAFPLCFCLGFHMFLVLVVFWFLKVIVYLLLYFLLKCAWHYNYEISYEFPCFMKSLFWHFWFSFPFMLKLFSRLFFDLFFTHVLFEHTLNNFCFWIIHFFAFTSTFIPLWSDNNFMVSIVLNLLRCFITQHIICTSHYFMCAWGQCGLYSCPLGLLDV